MHFCRVNAFVSLKSLTVCSEIYDVVIKRTILPLMNDQLSPINISCTCKNSMLCRRLDQSLLSGIPLPARAHLEGLGFRLGELGLDVAFSECSEDLRIGIERKESVMSPSLLLLAL